MSLAPPLYRRGKVREMYELEDGLLLMVASDRVSAFDVVMQEPIPGKGAVLTALSAFWFRQTAPLLPNHLVSDQPDDLPDSARVLAEAYPGAWLLVRRAQRIDVECVVRGYLAGSGWAEYRRSRAVCGVGLPDGLLESQRLERPIFTPTTKAESGHDQPLTHAAVVDLLGADLARRVEAASLQLYAAGAAHAESRGLILADTKFEFGRLDGGELIVIDELLTPDSSRYWPADTYAPGRPQPSFDKQFLRDYLERSGWNKEPPPPPLPPEVVQGTANRYQEALRRLTA
jgi:phosphoribosylaminoimidazole-succinocarboxamide synthase